MNSLSPTAGPAKTSANRPYASHDELATALGLLRQHFGDRLQTGEEIRRQHANTLTWIDSRPPDAVAFARSTEDVAAAVSIAARYRVPVVAFGGGTSLEGHVNAPFGGLSLDLSGLDRIRAVNAADLDCTVEAGVSRLTLNSYLRDTGLFFPVDPGAETATLGGMAATRASGTTTVRYGSMRDNVLSLTAVLADGSIVRTASRARKSSAGYDLTRLLVGSEGTLGIITEVTLRLYGQPEAVLAAVAPFETLEGACNATMAAISLGLGLARIELLDAVQIAAVNRHAGLSLDVTPTLFLEFHGTPAATREQVALFEAIARDEGASDFTWAEAPEERSRLWKARHDALWAIKSAWPGQDVLVTDVCVPISRLAACVAETEADSRALGLIAPIVGHVGDGNFHVLVLVDPADPAARSKAGAFAERLAHRAISMDGTCTGEHGIGEGKRHLLAEERGETGMAMMAAIKRALDPDGILNPGKII